MKMKNEIIIDGLKFIYLKATKITSAKILEYVNIGGENGSDSWINSAEYRINEDVVNNYVDFQNQCYAIIENLH